MLSMCFLGGGLLSVLRQLCGGLVSKALLTKGILRASVIGSICLHPLLGTNGPGIFIVGDILLLTTNMMTVSPLVSTSMACAFPRATGSWLTAFNIGFLEASIVFAG